MINKHEKIIKVLLIVITLVVISACSSLERADDMKNSQLILGASKKNEVVNAIGLPQSIEKNSADGTEAWFYTGKPSNTSYFIPMPIAAVPSGPNTTTVFFSNIGKTKTIDNVPVSLICIFDKNGVLIESQQPQKE